MKNVFDSEGDLREVDPLAALVSCWREKSSGALRFSRGPTDCGFDMSEGDVVGIVSSDPRFETAAILVRANKLAPDAVERLSGEGGDAAALALQSGLLTRREWKWGEKIRAIEVFSDLLSWNDGRYRFDPGTPAPAGDFRLPVPRLLLELFLRSRDRNLVDHQLGAPDQALVRSERFDEEFPTFGLTADAESVVRLIDGRSTAAQIADKAPADEFAVRKLLAALVTLGLVHPVPAAPARPAERLRAAEPPPPEPVAAVPAWPEEEESPPDEPLVSSVESETDAAAFPDASAGPSEMEPFEAGVPEIPEPSSDAPTIELPGIESSPLEDFSPSVPDPRWTPRHEEGARPEPALFDPTPDPPVEAAIPETADEPPPPRSGSALPWALGILVLAVVGVVLWRMRDKAPTTAPAARPTSAAAVTFPPPATAIAAVPARPTPAPLPTAPASPAPRAAAAAPPAGARAASAAANAAAPASAASTKSAEPDSRDAWAKRAERDRRRLEGDRRTRYAVQLELVCEVPSLTDAWHHDRAGAMWLLPSRHGDRDCYRVLWGRYATLEAARRGKSGIPSYFTTAHNKPAVVAVK